MRVAILFICAAATYALSSVSAKTSITNSTPHAHTRLPLPAHPAPSLYSFLAPLLDPLLAIPHYLPKNNLEKKQVK